MADSIPVLVMTRKEVRWWRPKLQSGECHLWHIPLEDTEAGLTRLLQDLSGDEKRRADEFLVPAPRQQYISTRSALRLLLGSYLAIPAASVAFELNAYGKLFLLPPHGDLRFNVSHSGRRALIAFCCSTDVGVDIEQHRSLDDRSGLAKIIWCDEELDQWRQLSPNDQVRAFYLAWTRKEALAKALGYGMTANFKMLRVSFDPAAQAKLIHLDPTLGVTSEWSLIDIDTQDTYSAAVAVRAPRVNIVQHHITPPCPERNNGFRRTDLY